MVRQFRGPQALTETAVFADGEFIGQDQVDEVEVAHLGLIHPPDILAQGFGQGGGPSLTAVVRMRLPVS